MNLTSNTAASYSNGCRTFQAVALSQLLWIRSCSIAHQIHVAVNGLWDLQLQLNWGPSPLPSLPSPLFPTTSTSHFTLSQLPLFLGRAREISSLFCSGTFLFLPTFSPLTKVPLELQQMRAIARSEVTRKWCTQVETQMLGVWSHEMADSLSRMYPFAPSLYLVSSRSTVTLSPLPSCIGFTWRRISTTGMQ